MESVEKQAPKVELYLDDDDFNFLKEVDEKVSLCHRQLGMLEEEKVKVLELTKALRVQRQEKVKEVEIKYRIPKGCRWNIDAEQKKIVFFDKDGKVVEAPVVVDTQK